MRAPTMQIAIVVAAFALAGCGGGDNEGGDKSIPGPALKFTPPSEKGVSTAIRDYLTALNKGDGKRACRLLDERGQASLVAFLPSNKSRIGCAEAVRRVSRQIVPVRRFKIEKVSVSGRGATANVEGTNPPYSSGVLLANTRGRWLISFPPGLVAKTGGAPPRPVPGVPLERD